MSPVNRRGVLSEFFYLRRLANEALNRGDVEHARILGKHMWRIYLKYKLRGLVKRRLTLCPSCEIPLKHGVTLRIRLRRKRGATFLVYSCSLCGRSWRRIVAGVAR
ncbi:MAG: ribonuclease P Rpr2/Rpp21/SNM1 subunit [Fervidicoccaceae archaeon]